jgi:UDP-N-acetylglucosamine 1-carboxyvinyltransferase
MTEGLRITGGKRLEGQVRLFGAKNSITKLLVASLLSDQRCTFTNVPNISEVEATVSLCQEIGSVIHWDRAQGILTIQTEHLKNSYIPQKYSGANRIPILMMGALLGRTQDDLIVPTVGGCPLGQRPVDYHVKALEALGAEIEYREMKREGAYLARAHKGLKGCTIELPYPSVGATENAILAGVRAQGTTILKGAALEPEVIDIIMFLQKMGAFITVERDRTIRMQQSLKFREVQHEVVPDRNVAVSYALAAAATKGRIFVQEARQIDLISFLDVFSRIGGSFDVHSNGIEFYANGPIKGDIHLETDVHPGYMTDWQQPLVVLLTQADGCSIVHETVYENRFGFVDMLKQMGAQIQTFSHCLGRPCRYHGKDHIHSAIIQGPTILKASSIFVPDLRAGFAYVMAALTAEGTSNVWGLNFLERGYPNLIDTLKSLGADVEKIQSDDSIKSDSIGIDLPNLSFKKTPKV